MPDSPGLFTITDFNPAQIPGLKIWYKANALSLNNNDPVGTWTDSSGNSNDATQSTAGNKPLYKTSIINGLPAVLFDGTDDFMTFTADSPVQPNSIFIVTQPTANSASQKSYAVISHGISYYIAARLSTNFWGTFTTGDISSTEALVSGSNYLLENTATTGNTFLYSKGVQKAFDSGTEVGSGGHGTLGKDFTNAGREYAGYLAEVIVYNSILSTTDRGKVETYCINKYAL